MNYAPVLISVLDRDVHFKRCIKSLSNCTHAEKTHLYIALDAPFANKHIKGYNKVLEFIPKIKGFKEVTLFKREINMGSSPNQFKAMDDIFKKYDRLIFTEDDNEFSPNFLDFVNQGLELFKDRRDIFSVSGHKYLVDIPSDYTENYYVWPGFDAWGVGIWRDKWNRVDFNASRVKKSQSITKYFTLNKLADHYLSAFYKLKKKGILSDDFAASFFIIDNKMYSIFPTISKVRNFGHDGSGENCQISDIHMLQPIDANKAIVFDSTKGSKPDKKIYMAHKKFFSMKAKQKCKLFIKFFL